MVPITLDWLHIAALVGAIQGYFLAAVLATQRRNRTANRLLAVAMLAFSIYLTSAVYHAAGLEQRFPHFFGVSYPLPLLFGPLIYLYAVSASNSTRRLRWRDGLHFAPVAAVVLATLPIYLLGGAQKIAFYHQLQQGVVPPVVRVVDPLKFVSGVSYAAATLLFLQRHRARVKDSYSSLERVNLQWLFRLALGSAAIWALATAFEMTEQVDHPLVARAEDVIALAIAILVYGIGYMALRQPEIFNFAALDHRAHPPGLPSELPNLAPAPVHSAPAATAAGEAAGGAARGAAAEAVSEAEAGAVSEADAARSDSAAPRVPPSPSDTPAARYERSGLTEKEAAALERALVHAMETERLYRNSDLTLADLAERLDTTPHKLSEVLNAQLGQTFYDFVNGYRVRDVERRIADERLKHLKILSLAMDAGFASKSTFNHVFRQHTGRTPSAYRRSVTG